MAIPQFRDQVQSGHAWHFMINDEAAADGKVEPTQQFGAVRIGADHKAFNLKRKFERVANGRIVVNDDDEIRPASSLLSPAPPRSFDPADGPETMKAGPAL
jgi:hypothetical protein